MQSLASAEGSKNAAEIVSANRSGGRSVGKPQRSGESVQMAAKERSKQRTRTRAVAVG